MITGAQICCVLRVLCRSCAWFFKPYQLQYCVLGSAAKRPVGTVEVKIIRARNLWKTDFMGKADPYVKIRLVNSVLSKTTRTKANTLNPEWHEIFKLPVQDPKSQSLELEVFDWEKVFIAKTFLASLLSAQCFPVSAMLPNTLEEKMFWL